MNDTVAEYLNEHFYSAYEKVGTFQIINGQKVGGNVASYFCLGDGSVLHAIAGPVDAKTFLKEARYAIDLRKNAISSSTNLATGVTDVTKYRTWIKKGHVDRYKGEFDSSPIKLGVAVNIELPNGVVIPGNNNTPQLPRNMPSRMSQQGQVQWLMATQTLAKLDMVYPIVWQGILREKLSSLPVIERR
jgi:hypothetical protein